MSDNIEKIESKIDPLVLKLVKENPDLIKREIDHRKKFFPTKNFIPNIGQEKGLNCYRQRHPEYGDYPTKMFYMGGNGVGKTCNMAILLAGVSLGNKFLNPEYYNFDYFNECEAVRKKRRLKVRIVCNKADMEENGSVVQEVKKWIPVATLHGKVAGKYYTEIRIPAQEPGYYLTLIDIKTHDQRPVAHAGPDYDLVIFNEPPNSDIFAENEARTRVSGRIAAFLTPLDMAEYMDNIIHSICPEGEIYYTRSPIWDNCKDIIGNRGHLRREKIESMIRTWKAINPMEVPAREEGRFMHLAGSVFQIFNPTVHVIPNLPIEDNWNIYQIVDPHPVKPHCAVWIAVTPANMIYVIAEYPTEPWDQISNTILTIKDFGHEFKRIETGRNENFLYIRNLRVLERFGDPNAFKAQHPLNRKTVQQEYEWECGLDYNINVDNDILLRHEEIKKLLRYNPFEKVDSMNTPHLFVYMACKNVARALECYSCKKDRQMGTVIHGKYDETWKHWVDCLGYGTVTIDGWTKTPEGYFVGSDGYEEIDNSRDPYKTKNERCDQYDAVYSGERFI